MILLTLTATDMEQKPHNIDPERSLQENMLTAALEYLKLGFRPIPLPAGSKAASIRWKEFQTSSPTEDQVREWFSTGTPNIALVTGAGVVVVDVDDPELLDAVVEHCGASPMVRVEYEQAIAIGGIGECLAATKNKNWGARPQVLPLEPDDWFFPDRITYLFRSNSLYNRRFHQRRRMKNLLGIHRKLVGDAKSDTKEMFLKHLTSEQIKAINRVFHVGPGAFWRAAKGKAWLALPPEFKQGELDFGE